MREPSKAVADSECAIRVALVFKYFEPAAVGMPIENPLLLPFRYQRKIVNLLKS